MSSVDLTRNPSKMSEQELRQEVKTWRQLHQMDHFEQYEAGYKAGWKACGKRIIKEAKKL